MVLDDDLRQKLEEQLELLAERSRKQETTCLIDKSNGD